MFNKFRKQKKLVLHMIKKSTIFLIFGPAQNKHGIDPQYSECKFSAKKEMMYAINF